MFFPKLDLFKLSFVDFKKNFLTNYLLDRRVRELNVGSELLPLETSLEKIKEGNYKAILISGGKFELRSNNDKVWKLYK